MESIKVRMIHPFNNAEIEITLPENVLLRDVFSQLVDASFLASSRPYSGVIGPSGFVQLVVNRAIEPPPGWCYDDFVEASKSRSLGNDETVGASGLTDGSVVQICCTIPRNEKRPSAKGLVIGGDKEDGVAPKLQFRPSCP
jgi:hypothetical protein